MHIRQIFQSLFQKNSQRSMKSATGFEESYTSKQIKFRPKFHSERKKLKNYEPLYGAKM